MRFRLPSDGFGLPPAARHDPCEIILVRRRLCGDHARRLGCRHDSPAQRQLPQGFASGARIIRTASQPFQIGPFGLFGGLGLFGNVRAIGAFAKGHRLGGRRDGLMISCLRQDLLGVGAQSGPEVGVPGRHRDEAPGLFDDHLKVPAGHRVLPTADRTGQEPEIVATRSRNRRSPGPALPGTRDESLPPSISHRPGLGNACRANRAVEGLTDPALPVSRPSQSSG